MLQIVPLTRSHATPVADLHMAHLSTAFHGQPGRHLLTAYYRTVARGEGACGYVAQTGEKVAGYICGVWAPDQVRKRLLCTELPTLLSWGAAQIATNPALLRAFIDRFRGFDQTIEIPIIGYELRPIVLAPSWRGSGVAADLVSTLLADAQRRGFNCIHLYANVDNKPANHFYRKMGFRETQTIGRDPAIRIYYKRSVITA